MATTTNINKQEKKTYSFLFVCPFNRFISSFVHTDGAFLYVFMYITNPLGWIACWIYIVFLCDSTSFSTWPIALDVYVPEYRRIMGTRMFELYSIAWCVCWQWGVKGWQNVNKYICYFSMPNIEMDNVFFLTFNATTQPHLPDPWYSTNTFIFLAQQFGHESVFSHMLLVAAAVGMLSVDAKRTEIKITMQIEYSYSSLGKSWMGIYKCLWISPGIFISYNNHM